MAVRFSAQSQAYTATTGLPTGSSYTIAFWLYLTTNRGGYSTAVELSDQAGTAKALYLGTGSNGLTFYVGDNNANHPTGASATPGTWYQYALVVNGTSGTLYVAAQGNALASTGFTLAEPNPPSKMWVGADEFTGWINGRLAALKVWNAALSSAEVTAEFAQFDPVRTTNLLPYYRFATASTADNSGNGFTLSGGTGATTEADPPGVPESANVTVTKTGSDTGAGAETGTVTASTTGSDAGSGSDSGGVSVLRDGSDTATGSESGFVSIPQTGSDTATGGETGSVGATVTSADTATGTATGSIAATTTGADTAAGNESGFIMLPGADTATGTDQLGSLHATVTSADTGAGSDGGYVETLFGDLVVALWAVDPDTGALLALPDYTKLTLSPQRNSAGSVTLDYPTAGQNFAVLRDTLTADRDLEIEIWSIGSPLGALRGYLQEASGDDVTEDGIWTFAGGFLELRMAEAVVFPQPDNDKQELQFSAATPGAVVAFILDQAQSRGALTDITAGFTTTEDSSGTPWPKVVSTKFSPGAGYDQILGRLVDFDLAEWAVTWTGTSKRLDLWVPEGRGEDRTVGLRPVVLRRGRNLLDAPRKWSVRDAGTALLAAGSEGLYDDVSDADALARRDRRIEAFVSTNNLTDTSAVTAFAQQQLRVTTTGLLEVTHGLGFLPGEPRPLLAFDVGDWVYSQTATVLERLRVVQWTLTVDASQNPAGTVTLNDTVSDALIRMQQRLNALTSGDTVVGTSSAGVDNGVPNPPTGLTASSLAYQVGNDVLSSVTVGWIPPGQNTDGSACTDLAGFTVQFAIGTGPYQPGANVNSGSATQASFSTTSGTTIHLRVAAFDRSGNTSVWSAVIDHTTAADATPPAVPSTPVVSNYLGVLKITWDGLTASGAAMLAAAPDFHHVEVHVSAASGFTPSAATYFDRLYAAGTQVYADGVYDTTYFARLVAVDGSGNASAGSAQGSDTPSRVVSLDVFDGAIGSAKLADLAVTTAKINLLAVNDAQVGNLSVGKLTAGVISVAVTNAGIIRSGISGQRYELDAAAFRLYNSSGAQTVQLNGSLNFITGELRTAMSGERIVFNSGGAAPNEARFYPATGTKYGRMKTLTSVALGFEGQAGMTMKSYSPRGDQQSGEVSVFPDYASIAWADEMDGGAISSRISATSGNVFMGGPKVDISYDSGGYANIGRSIGNVNQLHTVVRLGPRDGGDDSNAAIGVVAQHSYLQFDTGILSVVNDSTLVDIQADQFIVGSERRTKSVIEPIPFDPTDVVRSATSYRYEKRGKTEAGRVPAKQLGLMVDEMPDEVRYYNADQDLWGLDVYGVLAILWAAVRKEIGHRERSDLTLAEVERVVRGTHLRSVS